MQPTEPQCLEVLGDILTQIFLFTSLHNTEAYWHA